MKRQKAEIYGQVTKAAKLGSFTEVFPCALRTAVKMFFWVAASPGFGIYF